jgi:hypothetical protein
MILDYKNRGLHSEITTIDDTFFCVVANSIHYIGTDPDPDPAFSKKVLHPDPLKRLILKKMLYTTNKVYVILMKKKKKYIKYNC